ncbi:MAG: DUF234 domain-containing protein [Lachnospiraceae bacterium]|nr:DUF234 domain-containing protein [Lachnospiraceae bacterium]
MIKQILKDHAPGYKNEDLLALYAITGGIPKYLELFCDNRAFTLQAMVEYAVRANSPLVDEGRNLLIEEFGKNHSTYFSILEAISGGINTQNAIEDLIGGKGIGGHLKRLQEDYHVIERFRPIFSKEGTHSIKYEISDPFLKFWFRFLEKNRSMIEIGNYSLLRETILGQFHEYAGMLLERYFKQKLAESGEYAQIGSWWEPNKDQYQIDIVAIRAEKKCADVIEVKRNKRSFRRGEFEAKARHLQDKALPGYKVDAYCLGMEDM